MPQLKSSNLDAAEYEPETRQLAIRFKSGAVYTYSDVDEATYNELLTASSAGRYFSDKIRDVFSWTKG